MTSLYIGQVLKGLSYLHANKVVHGSIRGSNILITKGGQCKLADFGLTKPSRAELLPYWSSPEVVDGTPPIPSDDVWSVAATAIQLIREQPPHFSHGPVVATLRIIQDSAMPLPEGVSEVPLLCVACIVCFFCLFTFVPSFN